MKINEETILKLASLSKLKFEKKEMDLITNDMQKMIDFIQTLDEINTDGVEPLIHMTEGYNNWREDEVKEMLDQKEVMQNRLGFLENEKSALLEEVTKSQVRREIFGKKLTEVKKQLRNEQMTKNDDNLVIRARQR